MSETTITTNPDDIARLHWQERIAEANGFTLARTFYALGTDLIPAGEEKYRQSRAAFDRQPHALPALQDFVNAIAAEERKDHTYPVRELRMLPTGEIINTRNGNGRALLSGPSFAGLLKRSSCPEPGAAATYLATIPADRRAREVNSWLENTDAATPDGKPITAVLRCRNAIGFQQDADQMAHTGHGPREIYAVVSERYSAGNEADAVARALASVATLVPGDARAMVEYDGMRFTLRILWHSNVQPERVKVGEVYQAFAGFTSEDDGTASIRPSAGLLRAVCINLTSMESTIDLGVKRHTGNGVAHWLADALRSAVNHVRDFAIAWDGASAQELTIATVRDTPAKIASLPDGGRLALVEGTFRGLLKTGALSLPGYRGEAAVSELVRSFRKEEPNYTRAGIVNAITRTAHESSLRGPWAAAELESQAGAILANPRPFSYVERGKDF